MIAGITHNIYFANCVIQENAVHLEKTAMGTWFHLSVTSYENQSTNTANEAKTFLQQNSFCERRSRVEP